ncbi:MAG: hypothetical protein IKQ15_12300, partial [Kiritimatiellae bacterium]|nr:hypothetical protein [Kiritimatiellia bacterium]
MLAATAAGAALDSATLDGNTRTLYGGTVYTVAGNVTIAGASCHEGIKVVRRDGPAGNRVVVNIPEGRSLTVKGGAAEGRTGAGAGILLPADVTLYVTGSGTLAATGGNAASGGDGGNGSSAVENDDGDNHHKNGAGGNGGHGGGGAAAGIGGSGGKGASGGS